MNILENVKKLLSQRAKLQRELAMIDAILAPISGAKIGESKSVKAAPKTKRKGMSAAARAKISKAAKARWAKVKASGKSKL